MQNRRTFLLTLATSAGPTGLLTLAAEAPPKITVKVSTVRKQKAQSGDPDDKIQRLSFRIDIANEERSKAFNAGKVIIVAFADDVQDRDEMIVIAREEFSVSLDPLKSDSFETKQTKIVFDDKGYKYGQKYAGHVFALMDAAGNMVKTGGSSPALTKYVEAALQLKVEDVCDKKMKFVKKGYLRTS